MSFSDWFWFWVARVAADFAIFIAIVIILAIICLIAGAIELRKKK